MITRPVKLAAQLGRARRRATGAYQEGQRALGKGREPKNQRGRPERQPRFNPGEVLRVRLRRSGAAPADHQVQQL
jgi:hypothetical protein